MRLLKKALRPIYKRFFERPLWAFLFKVKVFLMADLLAQIEPKIAAIEGRNAAEWRALEQLLLAVIRLPEQGLNEGVTRRARVETPETIASATRDSIRSGK